MLLSYYTVSDKISSWFIAPELAPGLSFYFSLFLDLWNRSDECFCVLAGLKKVNLISLMPLKQKVLGKCKADSNMLGFSHLTLSLIHILYIHEDEMHLWKTLWLCLFNTFPGLGWKNDLWIGLDFTHWNFFGRWQHMRSFYTALITIKSFTNTSLVSQDRAYLT